MEQEDGARHTIRDIKIPIHRQRPYDATLASRPLSVARWIGERELRLSYNSCSSEELPGRWLRPISAAEVPPVTKSVTKLAALASPESGDDWIRSPSFYAMAWSRPWARWA